MIAVPLLLAACLMQAEAAPAEPIAPVPPPTADPGPAGPAEAAPAEPGPPKSAGPAAPAAPAPAPEAAGPPMATASIIAGLASRIGTDASRLGPTVGFSFGASLQHRYAVLSPELVLGLAADFLYYRFSNAAPDRTITETTFALLQTFDVRNGATHVWFGAGGGVAVGFFSSNDLSPATASARQPFARVVGGADVAINAQAAVGFRAGYMSMLTSGAQTTGPGDPIKLFVDLLDIQVGLFYRFR
jgi:hypothetical protein